MSVEIPAHLTAFVDGLIANGRCKDAQEVVVVALTHFRDYVQRLERLRQDIQAGIESGPSIPGDEVFRRFEARLKELATRR